jgi:hypothetical protein
MRMVNRFGSLLLVKSLRVVSGSFEASAEAEN